MSRECDAAIQASDMRHAAKLLAAEFVRAYVERCEQGPPRSRNSEPGLTGTVDEMSDEREPNCLFYLHPALAEGFRVVPYQGNIPPEAQW